MIIEKTSPSEIYNIIDEKLTHIVNSLTITFDDPDLKQVAKNTREQLSKIQGELKKQLDELERNAEWSTFTIAFYGETGAGKSTLIETLRVLLNEPSKRKNQKKFRQYQKSYEQNKASLLKLKEQIQSIDVELQHLEQEFIAITKEYEQKQHDFLLHIERTEASFNSELQVLCAKVDEQRKVNKTLLEEIDQLKAQIADLKRSATLWQKLMNLFRKLPEKEKLSSALDQFSELTRDLEIAEQTIQSQQLEAEKAKEELHGEWSELNAEGDSAKVAIETQKKENDQKKKTFLQDERQLQTQLDADFAKLSEYADGGIIGDGCADFTRKTQRYDFTFNGNTFALLDVPGIEGKEGLVLSEIEKSVQTAHAVFYVTNKAAPPQTGDDERKGTLEKIKQHLGAQTEVWSIFNKKITNPKYTLKNRPLISEDEGESLTGLETKMREQLGDNYKKVISLTALPAFIAATDHFVPESQNAKRHHKFLQDFTEKELIEKSQMKAFLDILDDKVLHDTEGKINRANLNKAKEAVDGTSRALREREMTFNELAENIANTQESSQHQLHNSFGALQKRLDSNGERLIQEFTRTVRRHMYDEIEGKLKNDTFKRMLKESIEEQLEVVNRELPETITEQVKKFESEAADILSRFEEQTRELTSASKKLGSSKLDQTFNLKINIKSGINKVALASALIGAALAPFTGGASLWVAGGAALTAIVAVGKAIASFFSTKYRMSQQREATDDNLRNIESQLRESLRDSLSQGIPEMKQTIVQIEKALEAPLKQTQATIQLIQDSNRKLKNISEQIKIMGT